MLELRPNCGCCDHDLPFDSAEASGCFVARPIRPARLMAKYPASTSRALKPPGCSAA